MRVSVRGRAADGGRPGRRRWPMMAALVAVMLSLGFAGFALVPLSAASAQVAAVTPPSAHPATPGKAVSLKKPAAPSAAQRRAIEAQAARQAIAHATVPDTCSGAISPDVIYPCSTPDSSGTDTFTVTLANPSDQLLIRILQVSSFGPASLPITVTAPDNSTVSCQAPIQLYACATSQAGQYTIAVQNEGSSYTITYTAVLAEATCPAINPSFAAAPAQGSAAAGATGNCHSLSMPSGHVLHEDTTTQPNAISVGVYDATGSQVCGIVRGDCTLTGTAPYRVFVSPFYGEAETYTLELNDISQPVGCAAAAQLSYGQVPALAASLCQSLTVGAAGSYQLSAAGPGNLNVQGALYDSTAAVACPVNGSGPMSCTLAAGTYYFIASGDYPPLLSFGVVLIAASESRGCAATGDTGFASGPATGTFTGAGEEICLTLPTASGLADYIFNQPSADGSTPQAEVVDATGAQQCGSSLQFGFATCTLSGTAPFRVILFGQNAGGGYRYLIQRTDSTAGCAAWPQSGFGGSFGATATLTFDDDVKCLTIPAGQHSTGEMIDYANSANVVNAAIYVNDPAGQQVCLGNSTAICAYQPGVSYTALVVTVAAKGDTYHLVRRDVSQTATCSTPPSTTVGGPSATFTLTSDLDTRCYRVTGATADRWYLSARALAPNPGNPAGAVLQVTNPNGAGVCREFGTDACKLSGQAQYQLIVTASNYAGVAITTHLDTWRVGGAAGWAAECTANHFTAANGFPLISGTLTEQATGYCAVIDTQQFQSFNLPGTATNVSYPNVPNLNVWAAGTWTPAPPVGDGLCTSNFGTFGVNCAAIQQGTSGSDLLVLDLGRAQSGTGYEMQGVCKLTCAAPRQQATLTAVSPASQPAQPGNVFVITGANLNLGTLVQLSSEDVNVSTSATGTPTAVNAAGTSLTVALDSSGLTPSKYDVILDGPGFTGGIPSPGYLPNAYTVTAAPPAPAQQRFTAVNPARILDTRTGLGAAKAKVPAHGTLTLTVTGQGGVPASNVAAVALDVTAISPAAAGYLIAYPAGKTRPGVSDLNYASGQTATNLIVVALNGGKVSIYNNGTGTLDLTADVVGYHAAATSGSKLTTMSPARLLNTTTGTGAAKARVAAHATVALTVTGRFAIPVTGVTAVALNVTALSPSAVGSLTVYPNGTSRPSATSLSFAAGQTVTSAVIVRLVNGKASLYNNSAGTVDLYADAVGYYSAKGSTFLPVGPQRVLDTRSGLGGSGQTVLPHAAAVTTVTDVPALVGANVTAVALEVTVTGEQQAGSLTVFPDFTKLPTAPSLRFAANRSVTGFVIVPVVNGNIDFYDNSSGNIQVLADLVGYYSS